MRYALTFCCATLVVAGAVLHGRATQRWETLTAGDSRIGSLHSAPLRIGDYVSTEIPSEMPIKEKSRVTCHQYSSPSLTGTIVVSLTTGIPGSVSTHTPDVCYVGSGYRMTGKPVRQTIDLPGGKTASYFVAEFEKKRATGVDRQRVRWAWTADGNWDAPDNPRFQYLRTGELAKVYLVTPMPDSSAEASSADSPAVRSFTAQVFSHYSAALAR